MRATCWREPVSIRGTTLYIFAFDSLDSGQWNDMVSGVRIIDAFVLLGANVRPQFLRFRSRIQKLIDALGWRGRAIMREPAARIVAHLAGDIRLAQQGDMDIQETSTANQNKSFDGARGTEKQTTTGKLMQEAFLSLALVTRDRLVSADDFDHAVQKTGVGPGEFVARIKAIVEDNCEETAESLRIVKLCWRIVEPMMERDRYAQHFKNKEFVKSLSNASEIMSNLESCMLFAGTDFKRNKTMRPLLFDIEKRALHLVG
ncbi:hypothetical protein HU200_013428 [Digitaria exilis]|uniref:Uncharacterized protein n=1 Tax=Digitaria exilis TaxID=1010633 RepID=A0A835FDX8_9POAL|nr:hypothetical protein HU200_013428 [Digitaria exilis]